MDTNGLHIQKNVMNTIFNINKRKLKKNDHTSTNSGYSQETKVKNLHTRMI